LANVRNGMSTMYLAAYKRTKDRASLDSALHYLLQAFSTQREHPGKVSGNAIAISGINLANYYMEFSDKPIAIRKKQAYTYLDRVEDELNRKRATADKWVNVFGIKSGFALLENDIAQA